MSVDKSILEIKKLIADRKNAIEILSHAEVILKLINEKKLVYISSNGYSSLEITDRIKDYLIDGILNEMEYLENYQKNIDSKLESIGLLMGINE